MQSTQLLFYNPEIDVLAELYMWGRFGDLIEGETSKDEVYWSGVLTCDDPEHFGWHYIGEV